MEQQRAKKREISDITKLHFLKLIFRFGLLVSAAAIYFRNWPGSAGAPFGGLNREPVILGIIWLAFALEMIMRCFPSKLESMGCQKQFQKQYQSTARDKSEARLQSGYVTLAVAAAWFALNGVIGILYFAGVIDKGMLLLLCLAYSVCDMICILFFCPFQNWFMKNKCCVSCRIYNWDYAMMFTPLVFVPGWYGWSLLGIALVILLQWEVLVHLHPERFSEVTNGSISCEKCQEKLCRYKTHLQRFIALNGQKLFQESEKIIEKGKGRG